MCIRDSGRRFGRDGQDRAPGGGSMKLTGKAWKYGPRVDTDVIIPARYLTEFRAEELAKHCMEDLDPTFVKEVKRGDVIVAGRGFGIGSSRENAPVAIKASGIAAVIAPSFLSLIHISEP